MKSKITLSIVLVFIALLQSQKSNSQVDDVQVFGFIHSLVHHASQRETPIPETATFYWVNDIVQSTSDTFAASGTFGQLTDHVDRNLPPTPGIGYNGVPGTWDPDTGGTFTTSTTNTILITAANFIQYVPSTQPDPADPTAGRSVVSKTETLFDWLNNEKTNLRFYIYGNWPEMDLMNSYPPTLPTQNEIDEFHNITMGTSGSFDSWWTDYQDAIVASRSSYNARLIPVGRIISQILTSVIPNQIPFDELYEDSDPHGRANIYFLAGMITYVALYEKEIPASYMPSSIISPVIRNNLTQIRNFITQELNNFNFSNGDSRVFYNRPVLSTDENQIVENNINIVPNPVTNTFQIESQNNNTFDISIYNVNGQLLRNIPNYNTVTEYNFIDINALSSGIYFLRLKDQTNNSTITRKIIKR
ncbi:T9SS type A sorting domain-containing protein [uncultured Tenacibaculum sp.]|uniref:T9SS type A sorting domain-containing protein n=1 Tax=uncultured Tenacibaculum sp. TaxID=174713 RepID=UPI002607FEB1|nr:T9SS type A sorting domain-containing protein [uncultured Tenacibaculum sp.]